ncbi:uncharacterized protein LOC105194083 [Solenopsis invicta]|uniref:uncharacterized protein LOC105194083 n=1 Tax=Solenopsis invicta TaxID=13686 RepID=UPI00193E52B2|nr:uncharacterized protein LOC105194083 [Solenopsis invicta]
MVTTINIHLKFSEFQELDATFYRNGFYKVLSPKFSNEIKLSFSIRVLYGITYTALICDIEGIYKDSCYRIILNIEDYTQTKIQKCVIQVLGFYISKDYPEKDSNCYNPESDNYLDIIHGEYKWRTFVITWNLDMGKVILYDTDKIILTYKGEKRQLQSENNYYMLIRSSEEMSFRLHLYDFLHTTVENATLISPSFQVYDEVICVQLLVGLCFECDAQIMLRDSTNDAVLAMEIVKGSTKKTDHGLPMWQYVIIKNNLINYSNYRVIIQLIPKLSNRNFNPLWAIANVRQCPLNETLRKNVLSIKNRSTSNNSELLKLNITCQKLFYNEHAVVNPMSSDKSNVNLDASNCPLGRLGPKCLVSCEKDLRTIFNCRGIRICYKDGCTCAAGFSGKWCSESCNSNTYSYNCKKTCGSCLYNETLTGNRCDIRTGNCHNGCNNTNTEFYIPPLCQTSIEKPNAPTLISINETTIWANVSLPWKGEYEEISILYSFVIQELHKNVQQSWNKLFRNMTQVMKYFENMEPGFTYHIRLNLNISGVQIHSDWKVVETCNLFAEKDSNKMKNK